MKAVCVLCVLVTTVVGANEIYDTRSLDFIRHPVKENGNYSRFFGYIFDVFQTDNGHNKFFVGSPYAELEPEPGSRAAGDLYSCLYKYDSTECVKRSPGTSNNPKDAKKVLPSSESFGLTLFGNESHIEVCSPLYTLNCTTGLQNPGACFTSSDQGESWKQMKQQEEVCTTDHFDIMILLDGSASVYSSNFEVAKGWTKELVSSFDLEKATSVGVVQFSDLSGAVKLEIELGKLKSQTKFEAAVDEISYVNGLTYTGAALKLAVQQLEHSSWFDDPTSESVVIILTDGRASDKPQYLETAKTLDSLNMSLYVVGVGNSISPSELDEMSLGKSENVFKVGSFQDLSTIVSALTLSITNFVEGQHQSQGTNGLWQAENGLSGTVGEVSMSGVSMLLRGF